MEILVPATSQPGENWDYLEEIYARLIGQWTNEMLHVAAIVGGFDTRQLHAGQDGIPFVPVPKVRQQAAAEFLNQNAFQTPHWLLSENVLARINVAGSLERIHEAQSWILRALLKPERLARLLEQEARFGAKAYRLDEFLADLRKGVWVEIFSSSTRIDPYRRNLQQTYTNLLATKLHSRKEQGVQPFVRGELMALRSELARIRAVTDAPTRLHLEDARVRISRALDPKFAPPAPEPELEAPERFPLRLDVLNCWTERNRRNP